MGVHFVSDAHHLATDLLSLVLSFFEFFRLLDEFTVKVCIPLTKLIEPFDILFNINSVLLDPWNFCLIKLIYLGSDGHHFAVLERHLILDLISETCGLLHSFVCDCAKLLVSLVDDIDTTPVQLALDFFKLCGCVYTC